MAGKRTIEEIPVWVTDSEATREASTGEIIRQAVEVAIVSPDGTTLKTKISNAELIVTAAAVVPKLRTKSKSTRSIKVVGSDGEVKREITSEETLKALAERLGIETATTDDKGPITVPCRGCSTPLLNTKSGRIPCWCKSCKKLEERQRVKRWVEKNPEKKKEQDLKFRTKNPERRKLQKINWAKNNPEHARELARANQIKYRARKIASDPNYLEYERLQQRANRKKREDRKKKVEKEDASKK